MIPLTREDVMRLTTISDAHCISIYLPTHRKGEEVNRRQDQLTFKQILNEVEKRLTGFLPVLEDRVELLRPALKLQEDGVFWHNQSDTLVVFLGDREFSYFRLPYPLPRHLEVSHNYYVLPLLPLLNSERRFHLLMLALDQVRLLEVSPFDVKEINTESLIPRSIEAVVGADFEQKSLQYRGQSLQTHSATFFGHGEGKDDRKKEVLQYLQSVDRGLNKLLPEEEVPLVVASVNDVFGAYKKVNNYRHLWPHPVSGSPFYTDTADLVQQGWKTLEPYFAGRINEKVEQYREGRDRTVLDNDTEAIIKAGIAGRVDTLFVNESAELYGRYDRHKEEVISHRDRHLADVDLLNLAATWVFDQRGSVYLLPGDKMPEPERTLCAIYRYG